MSQTTVAPTPTVKPANQPAGTMVRPPRGGLRARGAGRTPRRLRLFQVVTGVLGIVLAGLSVFAGNAALTAAAQDTQRLELIAVVRDAEATWWEAHAAAAVAVADNTDTAAADRARQLQGAAASSLLTADAPAEARAALAAAQRDLVGYVRSVERALALSDEPARKELQTAETLLRSATADGLDLVVQQQVSAMTETSIAGPALALAIGAGLGGIIVIAISWSLARSTHRLVNLGLGLALVGCIVIGNAAISHQSSRIGSDQVVALDTTTAAKADLAQAQALVLHAAAVQKWSESDSETVAALVEADPDVLAGEASSALVAYRKSLSQVTKQLAAGEWKEARQSAGATKADNSGVADRLEAADTALAESATDLLETAVSQAGSAGETIGLAVAGVAISLGSAAAGIGGLNRRLKEYL